MAEPKKEQGALSPVRVVVSEIMTAARTVASPSCWVTLP